MKMSQTTTGFVPDVQFGRGAWTKTGKPNGSAQYTYVAPTNGVPAADGRLLTDDNHRAVHLAIKHSLQPALGMATADCDGRLGPGTYELLKKWQAANGLTPDGFFGRMSAAKAFRPLVEKAAAAAGIPAPVLHGVIMHESLYDPAAVGFSTPADRGLAQVSLEHHGPGTGDNFSEAQVHTASWAITYNAKRLSASRAMFAGKGADLQLRASVLEHNNPVNARHLYKTGEYRTDQARSYVTAVLEAMETY
jgi:hypothetical protein